MNEIINFTYYLEQNKPVFCAWGDFVANEIKDQLSRKISPDSISNFLKIEPKPRVKEISSALGKIGRKNYTSPQTQMTDLVGIRFVVLLAQDIETISTIIDSSKHWRAIIARDFEHEILENPKLFDYQSKHYEVRPKEKFTTSSGIEIPAELCCEVQVRSLLQHAYAELVHDNIYKLDRKIPKQIEREVAKSMALMEVTDNLFTRTLMMLKETNEPLEQILELLSQLYKERINIILPVNKKINMIFLETFASAIDLNSIDNIRELLDRKKYIVENVIENSEEIYFFTQPVVLLIYWLIEKIGADDVSKKWPLPAYRQNLELIFGNLDKRPSREHV